MVRPQASAFGQDAYPPTGGQGGSPPAVACRNHPLVDGNECLALAATIAFLGMNAERWVLSNEDAYDLVVDMSAGALDDVTAIADRLSAG